MLTMTKLVSWAWLARGLWLTFVVPIDSIIVPFCGLNLGSYKVIPKRNYFNLEPMGSGID